MASETVFLPAQINPDFDPDKPTETCDASFHGLVQGRVEVKGAPRGKSNFIKTQEVARKGTVLKDGTVIPSTYVKGTTPGARNVMNMQREVIVDGYDGELNKGVEQPKNYLMQDSRILQYGQVVKRASVDKSHRKMIKTLKHVADVLREKESQALVCSGSNKNAEVPKSSAGNSCHSDKETGRNLQ